ncbi:unnamed protein product [Protopolystoma xenopodis]|uniref:Uncharacterized protein n=1 Tax=Protopolystoma xenopodis TaxID=117903 RepID=A0A3S5BHG6_9PLAT|nr:unnamed protein product [Protopolystoma xenopodis]
MCSRGFRRENDHELDPMANLFERHASAADGRCCLWLGVISKTRIHTGRPNQPGRALVSSIVPTSWEQTACRQPTGWRGGYRQVSGI